MIELILSGKENNQRFSLEEGTSWIIGRGDDCNIFLNHPSISRHHCGITQDSNNSFTVVDLASSAGTFVNNIRISDKTVIHDGDELRLGELKLIFCMTQPKAPRQKTPNPDLTIVGHVDKPIPASKRRTSEGSPKHFPLKTRLLIGRAPECDVLLASPGVSRFHAELRQMNDGRIILRDLNSANGTFVNGAPLTGLLELGKNYRIRIGPFIIRQSGDGINVYSEHNNTKLVADKLTKNVVSRDTGKIIKLIDQVSLVINPREFVALLGGSGAGKSTLMDSLNGRRPPSSGHLMVNDEDFYANYRYFKTAIAYVPQKDIVHLALTVFEAFSYAARLRLPADTTRREIEERANRIIDLLGLKERRNTIIGNLSGGQLKRVSLGVELLAEPSLVYLDEATSGLDAGTEAQMMSLFRELADSGKTVICITHNIDNVLQCDLVAVLCKGKLAYYGPPADLPKYFDIERISQVYDKLETKDSNFWSEKFANSSYFHDFVRSRMHSQDGSISPISKRRHTTMMEVFSANFRQFWIFTARSVKLMCRDPRNMALIAGFPFLIGILIALVFGLQDLKDPAIKANAHKFSPFIMAIAVLFSGCINASKDIVKEISVYLRERAINLEIPAYLLSKVAVLSAINLFQCIVLLGIVFPSVQLEMDFTKTFFTLFATSLGGMGMGLCISSVVDNNDKAISLAILAVIPQIILAGAIIALPRVIKSLAAGTIVLFWANDAMLLAIDSTMRSLLNVKDGNWPVDILVIMGFSMVFIMLSGLILRRKDVNR
jgi:ABC-type multidrug transport system ATPase subunit